MKTFAVMLLTALTLIAVLPDAVSAHTDSPPAEREPCPGNAHRTVGGSTCITNAPARNYAVHAEAVGTTMVGNAPVITERADGARVAIGTGRMRIRIPKDDASNPHEPDNSMVCNGRGKDAECMFMGGWEQEDGELVFRSRRGRGGQRFQVGQEQENGERVFRGHSTDRAQFVSERDLATGVETDLWRISGAQSNLLQHAWYAVKFGRWGLARHTDIVVQVCRERPCPEGRGLRWYNFYDQQAADGTITSGVQPDGAPLERHNLDSNQHRCRSYKEFTFCVEPGVSADNAWDNPDCVTATEILDSGLRREWPRSCRGAHRPSAYGGDH